MKQSLKGFVLGVVIMVSLWCLIVVYDTMTSDPFRPDDLVAAFEDGRIQQGDPIDKCLDYAKPVSALSVDGTSDTADGMYIFRHNNNFLFVYEDRDDRIVSAQHVDLRWPTKGKWYLKPGP